MSGVGGIVKHGLECAGVSAEVIETVLTGLTVETQYTNIFKGLESHHKQHSYFKKHFQLVVSKYFICTLYLKWLFGVMCPGAKKDCAWDMAETLGYGKYHRS